MCGLAGFFNPNRPPQNVSPETSKKMLSAMYSRGPDEEGCIVGPHFNFGHRRLAIIDVSSGKQPMVSSCENFVLVFNGEIYNHQVLRVELETLGAKFKTKSDTEVLLWAYQIWGTELLQKIKGMFAFAILDKIKNQVFAARDHVGKKPFYYYLGLDGTIFFASDLRALSASEILPGSISGQGIQFYLSLGFIPAPLTIYEKVFKLEAAEYLVYSSEGMSKQIYWDPVQVESKNLKTISIENLFTTAVKDRLESEVPLGAFLSGGLDSNLVVSEISKIASTKLNTYTMGFKDTPELLGVRDERAIAKQAAKFYECENHSLEMGEVSYELLQQMVPFLGEPLGDPSVLPTWLVCEEAKKHATVILTGDGGDEPFGGYTFRYLPHLQELKIKEAPLFQFVQPLIKMLAKIWPDTSRLPRPLRLATLFRNLSVSPAEAFFWDLSILRGTGKLFSQKLSQLPNYPLELVKKLYHKHRDLDPLNRAMYVDTKLYMCEDVLVKADRISMAHSLELRSPLLDKSILEKAFSIPSSEKIKNGLGKLPLRELAKTRVAPEILDFPKTGFSFPAQKFLREKWSEELQKLLNLHQDVLAEWISIPEVKKRVRKFLKGENSQFQLVWSLFVLLIWIESFHNKQTFQNHSG